MAGTSRNIYIYVCEKLCAVIVRAGVFRRLSEPRGGKVVPLRDSGDCVNIKYNGRIEAYIYEWATPLYFLLGAYRSTLGMHYEYVAS